MFKLYTYSTCGYCERVRKAFKEMGVKYQEIDADYGTAGSEELVRLGGKQQVPFLVDEDAGVSLYESNQIIEYARKRIA